MKISIQFEPADKQIPFDEKLKIIGRIKRACHNPVSFTDFIIHSFEGDDKQ